MISQEILKKVSQIEIRTRRWVNNVFSGEYESVFKGQGIEFDEVREYQVGDDVRNIDWNVSARMGSPFVKKFMEERELTAMLMVDMSSSGKFGTKKQLKIDLAVELSALLAFSAIKNNDRVGLIIFTDKIEKYIPPKKGKAHVLRLIRDLLTFEPQNTKTDIKASLEYLNKIMKRRSIVFMISDFLASDYEKPLGIANKKHDFIAVSITDSKERKLPKLGYALLEDAETGETVLVPTQKASFQNKFHQIVKKETDQREKLFKSIDVDNLELFTGQDYILPLVHFFRKRAKRI